MCTSTISDDHLYINLRRSCDCLWVSVAAGRCVGVWVCGVWGCGGVGVCGCVWVCVGGCGCVWVCGCGVDSLEVCVNAPLHLLILQKFYAAHINESSLSRKCTSQETTYTWK